MRPLLVYSLSPTTLTPVNERRFVRKLFKKSELFSSTNDTDACKDPDLGVRDGAVLQWYQALLFIGRGVGRGEVLEQKQGAPEDTQLHHSGTRGYVETEQEAASSTS